MEKGLNSDSVARSQKISRRRVQQIYKQYKETNIVPILHKSGRKAKRLADEHIELINKTYDEHKIGRVALEKMIQREHKIHIPHNAIYKHMLKRGLIQENPNKKKQRK